MHTSAEQYDAIVVGVGGMGSAAVCRLDERGLTSGVDVLAEPIRRSGNIWSGQ